MVSDCGDTYCEDCAECDCGRDCPAYCMECGCHAGPSAVPGDAVAALRAAGLAAWVRGRGFEMHYDDRPISFLKEHAHDNPDVDRGGDQDV